MPSKTPATAPTDATPVPVEPKEPATRQVEVVLEPRDNFPGVSVEVAFYTDASDDFELLEDLARLDEGAQSRTPAILRRMVPADDRARILNALRDEETGRVPIALGIRFVWALLNAASPNS